MLIPKRGNKFGAQITPCGLGHRHASKKEARRCGELHLLQRAGKISDLIVEPQFWFEINGIVVKHPNGRRAGFKPDFSYRAPGATICEDCKGGTATRTEAYALRIAIFRALYPHIELREV